MNDRMDDELGRLVERLPREIEPDRDLWPAIRARAAAAGPAAPPAWRRWVPAVAALLLVGTVAFLAGRHSREVVPGPTAPAGASEDYRLASQQYIAATAALMDELERRRDQLPPETVADVEANLRIIDQAIAEVEAALAGDGGDPDRTRDGQLLAMLHKQKMETLWRATRLSS